MTYALKDSRGYHHRANKRPLRVYLAVGWLAKESTHVQYDDILLKSHDTLHTVLTTK